MKVSTIIRTYNRGYILGEALKSALDQSYPDSELIVVDDGSTDNTLDVVRKCGSDKIRYYRHERNRGVAAACNTGVLAATGELIAILDSDDLWAGDKLDRQVAFLRSHPEVGAVFSDVEIWAGHRSIPSIMAFMDCFPKLLKDNGNPVECVFAQRDMYLCLLQEVPIKPTAVMVRRELFAKTGMFDESSHSGEDWEFFLRLSRVSAFGYINLPLAIQRWSEDATHRQYWEQDKVFLLKHFLAEKGRLENDDEAVNAVNRGISSHCSNLAFRYLYSGRRRKAISVYLQGFWETGEYAFLLRAASVLMPLRARDILKACAQKARVYKEAR